VRAGLGRLAGFARGLALVGALALLADGAVARLQIAPDEDPDLATGWAAYQDGQHEAARQRYLQAAERGLRVAQFNLAVMLMLGEGGPPDAKGAVIWLTRSAQAGFAQAQFGLALLYERGEGVARSMATANDWFARAAEQGHGPAQLTLATQYFLGRGVPRDMAQAARWYERAAQQDEDGAAYILASLYEHGDGVPQDTAKALAWYLRAATLGDPVARLKAAEMSARLRARP
jgi:TPR repeat protein